MTTMRMTVDEEEFKTARAELVEIKQSADTLLEVYTRLYEDLNKLYDNHPKLYEKLQQTVELPSNEDAMGISQFCASLDQEMAYLKDDEYLKAVLSDNFFEERA